MWCELLGHDSAGEHPSAIPPRLQVPPCHYSQGAGAPKICPSGCWYPHRLSFRLLRLGSLKGDNAATTDLPEDVLPASGGVHPVTSYVVNYISNFLDRYGPLHLP